MLVRLVRIVDWRFEVNEEVIVVFLYDDMLFRLDFFIKNGNDINLVKKIVIVDGIEFKFYIVVKN